MGGLGFITGTLGKVDRHLSLSVGKPFLFSSRMGSAVMPDLLVSASGNLRVARHVALVSENWFVPDFTHRSYFVATSIAARIMGDHLSADIGGVWPITEQGFATNGVPIPWLDFTYNF
jgi:hypothetical protein